jgi:hypothetical protein
MSAALIQGARGATEDIDLWFEDTGDPRIAQAVAALSERFDVVTHMSGLGSSASEYVHVRYERVEGIRLPLLPLERILESKRAAARPKDLAAAHAIEEALLLLQAGEPKA